MGYFEVCYSACDQGDLVLLSSFLIQHFFLLLVLLASDHSLLTFQQEMPDKMFSKLIPKAKSLFSVLPVKKNVRGQNG